jgi:hypothetical protein
LIEFYKQRFFSFKKAFILREITEEKQKYWQILNGKKIELRNFVLYDVNEILNEK